MIYFDNAATSRFKPKAVSDLILQNLSSSANPSRSAHNDCIKIAQQIYETRHFFAEKLGVDDAGIIFTSGCTEALNLAIFGYLFDKKCHVITTCYEHNSVLRPLFCLKNRGQIDITIVEPLTAGDQINSQKIKDAIREDTALIIVNHISNVTGTKQDIKSIGQIAKENNVLFLVDAAQSLGHYDINMKELGIDMLAAAGHKGLHGPQGVGFLAVTDNVKLNPIRFGGTGTNSESTEQPTLMPEGYESGTMNNGGIIGLGAGAKWTYRHINELNSKISNLTKMLISGLQKNRNIELYSTEYNGVVSFNINGMHSSEVANMLAENYDIALRSGLHCAPLVHKMLGTIERGAVRVSIGWNNTENEVKHLLRAIYTLAGNSNTRKIY